MAVETWARLPVPSTFYFFCLFCLSKGSRSRIDTARTRRTRPACHGVHVHVIVSRHILRVQYSNLPPLPLYPPIATAATTATGHRRSRPAALHGGVWQTLPATSLTRYLPGTCLSHHPTQFALISWVKWHPMSLRAISAGPWSKEQPHNVLVSQLHLPCHLDADTGIVS